VFSERLIEEISSNSEENAVNFHASSSKPHTLSPREIDLISLLRVKRRRTQMPLFRGKTCSLTYSPEGKHDEKNNISEGENTLFAWKCVFSPIASVLPAKEAVPCW
jgi:hypothetical protein